MKQLAGGLALALVMAFPAHAGGGGKAGDSATLEAALHALIGDAACAGPEQCRTVAVGAKACGGPQAYLAWSTLRTNEAALKEAAEAFSASRRRDVERSGAASNCAMVVDPGAYCAESRVCRLNDKSRTGAR